MTSLLERRVDEEAARLDPDRIAERETRGMSERMLRHVIGRERANGVEWGPARQQWIREHAPRELRLRLEERFLKANLYPNLVGAKTTFAGADPNPGFPDGSFNAVANTTTETNLWAPIAQFSPIPANSIYAGVTFECECGGVIGTTGTPLISMTPRIGTSTTATSNTGLGAGSNATLATLAAQSWYARFVFGVRKVGVGASASSATGNGFAVFANAAHSFGGTVPATIDFTVTQGFMLSVIWGAASASNTITCQWVSFRSQN